MKVEIISHTPNPEQLIATAAKLCYSNSNIEDLKEKQTPERVEKFIKQLSNMGHQSPLEHISFTFAIEDVSRSLLAQLTRHRIASYSVQSQRYVNMSDFKPVIPNDIQNNIEAKHAFDMCVSKITNTYNIISDLLVNQYLDDGYDIKTAEKKAIENARAILPNACPTKIIMTMNARSLLNFFELRCCNRAQEEIRELANEMLVLCKKIAPNIFKNAGASCVRGRCKEGKMSCGNPKIKQIEGQLKLKNV